MINERIDKVLVLAPHTDDGEFGCGGTIAKLLKLGAEVFYIAFSSCEKSVPKGYPSDILKREVKLATKKLGIKAENLFVLDYEVRTFSSHRQEILDDLIKFRNNINPDLVFIPSLNDIHQDHAAIAIEAVRAFKFVSILSYELPWNNLKFSNTYFSILSESDIDLKIEALTEYNSQGHRTYASEEYIKSLGRTRGVQIGKNFAEVFEVVRMIN